MLPQKLIAKALPHLPESLIWRFSRRYIAGPTLDDALDKALELNRRGLAATLDLLGEDAVEPTQVATTANLYRQAIEAISQSGLDCGISIKLSSFGLRFDRALCRSSVASLVQDAAERDRFIRIDMEDSSATQQTIDIYRALRERFDNVGVVLQSCLRRTESDLNQLLADGIADVRLCKGIYIESPEIAYRDRQAISDNFKSCLERLLAGGTQRIAIATHDPELIDHARRELARHKNAGHEFQMLLGVAGTLRSKLQAEGHRVRIYVPFGEHWHAYSMRRLRENPTLISHLVSNLFQGS